MRTSTTGTLTLLSLALFGGAAPAWSQEKVGVVTTVIGPVTVARTSVPETPLKFKDDIFLRDRVTTGDAAMTRILMGGKVVVTARERSTLTITEVPGLSTIDLTGGRIAVAVDKTRMKPGERVDVRTPNAIAGVRGTVLIVEALGKTSTVTVLRGLVDVVRLDPVTGRGVGPVTPVGARETVTLRDKTLPSRAAGITPERAQKLSQEFTPPVRPVSAASVMPINEEVGRATALLKAMLPERGIPTTTDTSVSPTTAASSGPTAPTLATPTPAKAATTVPSSTSPTATLTSPLPASTTLVPTTTLAPATTLVPTATLAPTTTLVPTATVVPGTTLVPTTTLASPPPTTTTVPTSSLLQPVVQPVQNLVQPILQPTTKLLK